MQADLDARRQDGARVGKPLAAEQRRGTAPLDQEESRALESLLKQLAVAPVDAAVSEVPTLVAAQRVLVVGRRAAGARSVHVVAQRARERALRDVVWSNCVCRARGSCSLVFC